MSTTNGNAAAVGIGDIDNLDSIIDRYAERFAELDRRIEALERENDRLKSLIRNGSGDRNARIERILSHAERVERGGVAAMDYREVVAATDSAVNTAYADMEYIAGEYDHASLTTGESGVKRLVINTDRVSIE